MRTAHITLFLLFEYLLSFASHKYIATVLLRNAKFVDLYFIKA